MTILATWLWQGIVIAAAIAGLLAVAPRLTAATRHAIWWAALVAVTLLPLAPLASRVAPSESLVAVAAPPLSEAAVPLPAAPELAVVALGVAYLLVVVVALLRIAVSVRAVHGLKRRSTPLPAARAARLRMWSALGTSRRVPELRVSREIRAASALGLGRPVILLSPSVLALDDDSLDGVVMHEYAHLARFDDWTQLIQALVSALFAAHPAVWYIGRRIRLEREAACDDFVLARGAAARRYARSLVEVADRRFQPWTSVAIPGATRSRSELRERVHRLLDATRPRDAKLARPAVAACSLAVALAVVLSARTPALVVFVEAHVAAPPVAALTRAAAAAARTVTADVVAAATTPVSAPRLDAAPRPAVLATPDLSQIAQLPEPSIPAQVPPPLAPLPISRRGVPADLTPVQRAAPPAPPPVAASDSPPGLSDPWVSVARTVSNAGKSTGSGAKSAGASIGRFFGRAGKAIAGSY